MVESVSISTQTIAGLCLDCQNHFRILHDTLRSENKDSELSSIDVQNELGRFRIWASDIGAMHIGRASLDHRLRDAEYLYQDVTSLLEDIKESLIGGLLFRIAHSDIVATSLVNDDSENPFLHSHAESVSETESDTSELPHSVKSEGSSRELVEENTYSLRGYYDQVVNFVHKLFDISLLIRKASRKFRTSRAAAHIETDAEGNDVLTEFNRITSLKIKGLYPETPLWLVQRLSDVITKRRQHFYYQKAHTKRRPKIPVAFLSEQPILSKSIVEVDPFESTKRDEPITEPKLPADTRRTKSKSSIKTYTTASELILEDVQPNARKPTLTEIRMNESIFPKPPRNRKYNTFQCNQCFEMLHDKMKDPTLWRSVSAFLN